MERCRHNVATWKKIGAWWEFSCSECNLAGWGPSPDSSKREFRAFDLEKKLAAIKRKKDNGETLTKKEAQIWAYAHPASCSSCYQSIKVVR